VGLDVPSIGLRTPVGDVGITADHRIDVPAARAGLPAYWYRLLASPGEAGTAVLVGHVDSAADGPGVFYRIGELGAGDVVTVHRDDGTAPSFVVVRVARFAKDRFPTDVVYGATGRPTLRLVTCGGSFDRSTGSYRDNVVVFADLTEPRRDRFGPPLPAPR
jgi:sortase (surface protein transpeptidase)